MLVAMFSVPLPQYGYSVEVVSLPNTWRMLASRDTWNEALARLMQRIGEVCQQHIRNIMMGQEPNKAGDIVPFLNPTGRGVQAVQFQAESRHVDIYVDSDAKYLTYQEFGVNTQPMKWLINKTVPYILARGSRVNPRTGRVVSGVVRVRYAGPGSRYAGSSGGVVGKTDKVGRESIDGIVRYAAITAMTFMQPSKYNPTGYRWWHGGYKGKHFFRDGCVAGLKEVAGHINGLSFAVAGASWEPDLEPFTDDYAMMLDDLEAQLEYPEGSPYPVNVTTAG